MKKCLRKDKREWANNLAREAEDAAKCGMVRDVFDAIRRQCSEPRKSIDMVRKKKGNLLTKEEEVHHQRWKEHFAEILNRLNPEHEAEVISDMEVKKRYHQAP